MAQMNRNVNLEEIDSDALFGIDALKGQSMTQKIVFWGSIVIGVGVNIALPLIFGTPRAVCVIIFLVFLGIGVAYGCNYTDDYNYGKFLYYIFFKPTRELTYKSTENVIEIRRKAIEIQKEEELKLKQVRQADPRQQKKLLIKLVAFIVILGVAIGSVVYISSNKKEVVVHHTVETEMDQ